jgi:hypothetical protein
LRASAGSFNAQLEVRDQFAPFGPLGGDLSGEIGGTGADRLGDQAGQTLLDLGVGFDFPARAATPVHEVVS